MIPYFVVRICQQNMLFGIDSFRHNKIEHMSRQFVQCISSLDLSIHRLILDSMYPCYRSQQRCFQNYQLNHQQPRRQPTKSTLHTHANKIKLPQFSQTFKTKLNHSLHMLLFIQTIYVTFGLNIWNGIRQRFNCTVGKTKSLLSTTSAMPCLW